MDMEKPVVAGPLPAQTEPAIQKRYHKQAATLTTTTTTTAASELPLVTNAVPPLKLGLGANWQQFGLLVLVNAFVGGMIGLERTLLPLLAQKEFGLATSSAALSFIVSFGLVKALTNFVAGRLSDKVGRKQLLIAGWVAGLPVPFLLIFAPSWDWVIFANILLGINQGLCWSTTVIMKIDLVGAERRGLAMGLNEAAGYLAVAATTLAAGYLAGAYGLRPYPFLLGVAFSGLGLLVSIVWIKETRPYARLESQTQSTQTLTGSALATPTSWQIFKLASWQNPRLFAISQAGLVNNLNDGLVWGLLPLYFVRFGLSVEAIAAIAATYLSSWGFLQLFTGLASDKVGRRPLIVGGMLLQGVALWLLIAGQGEIWWYGSAFLLGVGTALVYPTFLAAIGDVAEPSYRASVIGVYRLWRDSGYAIGAIVAGLVADFSNFEVAIGLVATLTILSGLLAGKLLPEPRTPVSQLSSVS